MFRTTKNVVCCRKGSAATYVVHTTAYDIVWFGHWQKTMNGPSRVPASATRGFSSFTDPSRIHRFRSQRHCYPLRRVVQHCEHIRTNSRIRSKGGLICQSTVTTNFCVLVNSCLRGPDVPEILSRFVAAISLSLLAGGSRSSSSSVLPRLPDLLTRLDLAADDKCQLAHAFLALLRWRLPCL